MGKWLVGLGLAAWLAGTAARAAGVAGAAPAERREGGMEPARLPMVVVSYDDSGDFGPQTPGTRTSGWQEAIAYCVAHHQDLYAKGGWGGREAVYHLADTIRIPPTQDFRITGGVYVLNWEGPGDRDLLAIDSGMDCHYQFGILVYGGTGAALRIRPEGPVPIDGFAVFTDSEVEVSSIADPHPFQPGERQGGAGVVFDTARAAITHCDFRFTAVLNFGTCLQAPEGGSGFSLNRLECGHLHTNADRSTLLALGRQCTRNRVSVRIGVDQGARGVRGVVVGGADNVLEVATRGGFPPGNDLILAEPARGNQVNLVTDSEDQDPLRLVSDRARVATNQLAWTGGPAPVHRVEAKAGAFTYTQRLFPATVRVACGKRDQVDLRRGKDRVPCGPGPCIVTLSVGDRLEIQSVGGARLTVIPLKSR